MSNPVFSPNGKTLIEIPSGINCGLYRALGGECSIPFAPLGDPLTNANTFGQVQAVKDSAKQVCNLSTGSGTTCGGFSRVSLWMTRLIPPLSSDFASANAPLIASGVAVPPVPPAFDIQLRWAMGNISETLFQGVVTPASWNDRGLIVQVSGVQADQIELWARIPNPGPTSVLSFGIALQWGITFVSDNNTVPVMGNLTKAVAIQQYV